MPQLSLEPTLLRRLVFCRDLYELAKRLRAVRTEIAMAQAVVVLDAAVETALPIVLAVKGVATPKSTEFPQLVKSVVETYKYPADRASAWNRLHIARNQIQHAGLIPSEAQIQSLGEDAISSLKHLIQTHLHVELEAVSVSELFKDNVQRAIYQVAEKEAASGNLSAAAVALIACFEHARSQEQDRITGSGVTLRQFGAAFLGGAGTDSEHNQIIDYIGAVHEEVEVLKLGLSYKGYRKFLDIAPTKLSPRYLQHTPTADDPLKLLAEWKTYLSPYPLGVDQEWVNFGLQFVREAVLQWQELSRKGVWEQLAGAFARGPRLKQNEPG